MSEALVVGSSKRSNLGLGHLHCSGRCSSCLAHRCCRVRWGSLETLPTLLDRRASCSCAHKSLDKCQHAMICDHMCCHAAALQGDQGTASAEVRCSPVLAQSIAVYRTSAHASLAAHGHPTEPSYLHIYEGWPQQDPLHAREDTVAQRIINVADAGLLPALVSSAAVCKSMQRFSGKLCPAYTHMALIFCHDAGGSCKGVCSLSWYVLPLHLGKSSQTCVVQT